MQQKGLIKMNSLLKRMLSALISCHDPEKSLYNKKQHRVHETPTRWNLRKIDKHTQSNNLNNLKVIKATKIKVSRIIIG
jgi:hypothetical protein